MIFSRTRFFSRERPLCRGGPTRHRNSAEGVYDPLTSVVKGCPAAQLATESLIKPVSMVSSVKAKKSLENAPFGF